MLNRRIPAGQWVAIWLVATFLFSFFLVRSILRESPPPPAFAAPAIVSVLGDVEKPGIHLVAGSAPTVEDAIFAAGGIVGGGQREIDGEFKEQRLVSGDQVRIFKETAGTVSVRFEKMDAASRLTIGLKLDINEASEEDLVLVPRMKQEMAMAIVSRRSERPWHTLDELTEIPGIGHKTVERWRDYLEVPRRGRPPAQESLHKSKGQ